MYLFSLHIVYPSNSLPDVHVHVQAGNRNQAKTGTSDPLDRSDQVSRPFPVKVGVCTHCSSVAD